MLVGLEAPVHLVELQNNGPVTAITLGGFIGPGQSFLTQSAALPIA